MAFVNDTYHVVFDRWDQACPLAGIAHMHAPAGCTSAPAGLTAVSDHLTPGGAYILLSRWQHSQNATQGPVEAPSTLSRQGVPSQPMQHVQSIVQTALKLSVRL